MAHQYIFTMQNLRKVVPPQREILRGIWLSFLPGAKIGVVGPNGAGKSTLLRIMAGLDDGFMGEARLTPGFTVGFLEQEPHLDESRTVREIVEGSNMPSGRMLPKALSRSANFGRTPVGMRRPRMRPPVRPRP